MVSKIYINRSNLIISVIFLFLFVSSLNNVNSSISVVGLLSLVLILVMTNISLMIYFSKFQKLTKSQFIFILISIMYFMVLLIGLINNLTIRGAINIAQFAAIIGFTIYLSNIYWDKFKIKLIGLIASSFILFHFILWILDGFKPLFSSIYNNSNIIGPYMLYSLFFIIWAKMHSKQKKFYNIIIIIALLTMYASGTRTAILAGISAFVTYLLWNFISKNIFIFKGYMMAIFGITISILFLYPYLPYWKNFDYFENLMITYMGKSLMSGRDVIWGIIINLVNEKPFLGYGTGVQISDLSPISISSHNYYLQVTMQNGYIGLFLILILLFYIWLVFWKARKNKTVKLVASFFVATIVYQSFEISLTQNQISIALLQWFIISIGINKYQQHKLSP